MFKKVSDGCTGVPDEKFRECCVEHDSKYHEATVTRLSADNTLFKCILNKGKSNPLSFMYYLSFASVYWVGVRLFGSSSYG